MSSFAFVIHWKFISAVLAIYAFYLAVEAVALGLDKSSIRLYKSGSKSAWQDLFWCLVAIFGITKLMSFGFSLGLGVWLDGWNSPIALCSKWSLGWQFIAVLLADTFVNYWLHRAEHCKLLWPLHKTHHSTLAFTGLSSFRNHPLEITLQTPIKLFTVGLLGIAPSVFVVYSLCNTVYQIFIHTPLRFGAGWFGHNILIDASRHEIHHSASPEHWNKNFGVLTIWDRVFGTYIDSRDVKQPFTLGIGEDKYNEVNPLSGVWQGYKEFTRGCLQPFLRIMKKPTQDKSK